MNNISRLMNENSRLSSWTILQEFLGIKLQRKNESLKFIYLRVRYEHYINNFAFSKFYLENQIIVR